MRPSGRRASPLPVLKVFPKAAVRPEASDAARHRADAPDAPANGLRRPRASPRALARRAPTLRRPGRTEFPVNSRERLRRARGTGPTARAARAEAARPLASALRAHTHASASAAISPKSRETSPSERRPAERRRPTGPRPTKHAEVSATLKRRTRACSHPNSLADAVRRTLAPAPRGFQSQEMVSHRCRKR